MTRAGDQSGGAERAWPLCEASSHCASEAARLSPRMPSQFACRPRAKATKKKLKIINRLLSKQANFGCEERASKRAPRQDQRSRRSTRWDTLALFRCALRLTRGHSGARHSAAVLRSKVLNATPRIRTKRERQSTRKDQRCERVFQKEPGNSALQMIDLCGLHIVELNLWNPRYGRTLRTIAWCTSYSRDSLVNPVSLFRLRRQH